MAKPRKDPSKAEYIRHEIKKWDDLWKVNRDQYHLFTTFVMGEQWTEDESRVFENYKKIPLTMNKLAPLINHLLGEQRQNTPNLQVMPEEGVDEQTAEVREALVKDLSLSGHAKVIYQIAFQQAAVGGFGAYIIGTKYENEYTFDQMPEFLSVKDPTRCFWEAGAMTPCKTDGMHAGNRTRVSRKKFAALYGKNLEKAIPTSNEENTFIAVADDDSITIIDWYERKYKKNKLYLLDNNKSVDADELKDLDRIMMDDKEVLMMDGMPVQVVDTRETHEYYVEYSKWAGDYELEKEKFPSEQLPVIFVDQSSYYDKRERQICRPFIKDAKDAQKYLNYLATQSAYTLKTSRYDQYIAARVNISAPDTQAIWRDPSTVQGALMYDESPTVNKPERQMPPELSQSLTTQYERALMDIQTSTGMYNTQIGEKGNEISGRAIDARTRRGSYNTFVPFDSLNRAIAVGGEIINEMIPKLYNTERTLKLNMQDRGETNVTLNKPMDEYGGDVQHDMTKGRYKIRLMPGPSYEGQKQENLESLKEVLQANPQLFSLFGDLYVENLPMANNIELKNRVRTIIPPEIIEAGKTGQPVPPKPPQEDPMVKIKMMEVQLKQQVAEMDAKIKMQELQMKEQEMMLRSHQAGVDFSKDIEKIHSEREKEIAKLHEQEMRFEAEMKRIMADVGMSHAQNVTRILTHSPKFEKTKEAKHGAA